MKKIASSIIIAVLTIVSFPDLDPDEWYCGWIGAAENAGIVEGYESNRYTPAKIECKLCDILK